MSQAKRWTARKIMSLKGKEPIEVIECHGLK